MCGSKRSLSLIDFSHVDILGHTLPILTSVKFLGVTFDSNLTFDVHISNIRRKCFLQVRNLYRVRKYVNAHCLFRLVDCLILTHLDYCNSLFSSCKAKDIRKLQRIMYSAARLLKRLLRFHHGMSNVISNLGWLPVKHRIQFKLCCLVHRIIHGSAPAYLRGLVEPAASASCFTQLRSRQALVLRRPVFAKSVTRAAFASAAPRAWNALPNDLKCESNFRVFKKKLRNMFMLE